WIGRVSVCGTGPASSTGSPTTLMMRPSVPSPTGTAIGWPVSITSCPRTSPSLVSIATVRTVVSPRCCATSSTKRLPWFLVSSALRIAGRWPSNCTSTTAPMTWVMCPIWLLGVAMNRPCYLSVTYGWRAPLMSRESGRPFSCMCQVEMALDAIEPLLDAVESSVLNCHLHIEMPELGLEMRDSCFHCRHADLDVGYVHSQGLNDLC